MQFKKLINEERIYNLNKEKGTIHDFIKISSKLKRNS